MIQRIQSVYLLLGAIAILSLFFFDTIWGSQTASFYPWFSPTLMVLFGLIGLTAIGAIFLYTNRQRQRKVVMGIQFLTILALLVLFGGFFLGDELIVVGEQGLNVARLIALVLPVVAYVLFFLARRGIESDIELVRSMDRLR